MAAAAMKHMASNFSKLDKFEGVEFRSWHKKMHFLLFSMSVVYVLTTLMSEDGGDNPTMEQVRKRAKFFVNEPNELVTINLIIESKDAIFDENRFYLVPRPSLKIPNETEDIGGLVVHKEDEVSNQHSYCFNVEDGPKTFDEATKSQGVSFWKEAINDEMDSIMGNNTLGFKQKSRIDYFDTYALVARISTIRLLIDMVLIYNLIIHQMDVKTAFLNGELEEDVYMSQPQGFIVPGNDNKEFLSSRFSMKDMREADVILGILVIMDPFLIDLTWLVKA
uniref:Zinc finger, CCHC-type n=1 Tax=Tanacetum cinerariifolium TaxID=118510 RepID=A0A6L2M7N0_TANCI|nr:zinc finger, CCHC-type [Tanacetum cinerariifolium]GEV34487.1 zinc finger, CCHC-type [Tanacetum cinerariifolium]